MKKGEKGRKKRNLVGERGLGQGKLFEAKPSDSSRGSNFPMLTNVASANTDIFILFHYYYCFASLLFLLLRQVNKNVCIKQIKKVAWCWCGGAPGLTTETTAKLSSWAIKPSTLLTIFHKQKDKKHNMAEGVTIQQSESLVWKLDQSVKCIINHTLVPQIKDHNNT